MAAERPSIISVKNDIIQVALPYIEGAPKTFSRNEILAAGTSLVVADNSDLAQNDYLIFGEVGQQQTEIVRITGAVTPGTALTISATVFNHPEGTKVTLIRYNQVEIYGAATSDSVSPTLIGSAVGIDVKLGYNEIKASTTYSYYYARFKNAQASTFSSYSDSVVSGGLSSLARGEIKREFLSIYNEKIDTLISDDWLNRTINRWQRVLSKRRKQWSYLRSTALATSVQDKQAYTLPTDIQDAKSRDAIVSLKFSNKPPLVYVDQDVFQRFTEDHVGSFLDGDITGVSTSIVLESSKDFSSPSTGSVKVNIEGDEISYTTNTKATNTLSGVTGIDASHSDGAEVWQNHTTGTPRYYTIDNGKFKVYPMPNSAEANKNFYEEYWRKFVDLSDDADETACIFPENGYLYLHWQVAVRRRLGLDEQLARKSVFDGDLENMVSEDPDFRDVRIGPHDMYSNPY